jgi:Spy/CpxP family protein refolding chaperone
MKRTRIRQGLLSILVIVLLSVSPAVAQGFKWWQNENFRRELGLTPEQSARLEEIFQASQPTLRTQKQAFDRADAGLERLVETGDEGAVIQQLNVVEAARAELNKSRTMMLLRMRRILTSDQRVKFTALHQALDRDRKGGQGGPGGPGGPDRGPDRGSDRGPDRGTTKAR